MEDYRFTKTEEPVYVEALEAFREANKKFALLLVVDDLSPKDYKVRAQADFSDQLGSNLVDVRHKLQPPK